MAGARLSHHGDDCSFETFLKEYELTDPILTEIAETVHDADLLDEIVRAWRVGGSRCDNKGMQLALPDDEALIQHSDAVFDGPRAYLGREVL